MLTVLEDVRYALRHLRSRPGFTIVGVLALALGIGATSAIFTVVDAVLLRPLPYTRPDELVSLVTTLHGEVGESSYPAAMDFAARSRALSSLAVYRWGNVVLTGAAGSVHVDTLDTSDELLHTLGVAPVIGRDFSASDVTAGANVAIISHALWKERYQGDPGIVGQSISVDGQSATVIGVLPAGFRFPLEPGAPQPGIHLLFPRTAEDKAAAQSRSEHSFRMVARLAHGTSLTQARADLETVAATIRHDHPTESEDKDLGIRLLALRDEVVAPVRGALLMLLAAVACVLFMACVNVAGIQLARAIGRRREMAVRTALGATRGRLVRQMLTESLLLGLLGGAAGTVLAFWLIDALAGIIAPTIPQVHGVMLDGRAFGVTLALAMVTGLAFGAWPALAASRTHLVDALQESAHSSSAGRGRRVRKLLLGVEIATAVVLLGASGVCARSFLGLLHVDPGFDRSHLFLAQVSLSPARFRNEDEIEAFGRRLGERVTSLPGVESAALGAPLPFTFVDLHVSVAPPGRAPNPNLRDALFVTAGPGYFETMGIRLVAGRTFNDADNQRTAAPTLIVSDSFARRMFGGAQQALGQHVQLGINQLIPEIVGVVGDVHTQSLDQPPSPMMYAAIGRMPQPFAGVVVRSRLPAAQVTAALHEALLSTDSESPPTTLAAADSLLSDTLQMQRAMAILIGLFGSIALALSIIGVFGVTSYTVAQRTRELAIRMALGASGGDIMRLVVGETVRLALVAIAAGGAVAWMTGQVVRSLLYGVSWSDPISWAGVVVVVIAACVLASLLPARHAVRVSPAEALLHE